MVSKKEAIKTSIIGGILIGLFTFSVGVIAGYPVESTATLSFVAGVASAGLGYVGMTIKNWVALIRGA